MLVKRHPLCNAYAATLVFLFLTSSAQAVTLEATADVWIRESQPDRQAFESDLMSVWSSFGNDGARRYGVVEFDVTSLVGETIDFAFLRLWGDQFGFSDDAKPIKQSAVFIDTTGGTQPPDFTWDIYQNEYAAGATSLEGLGKLDLTFESPPPSQFYDSMGSEADRNLIESVASGAGNQLLTIVLIADEDEVDMVDYAHSWGDGPDGFGGMNAQLVINEIPPENPDLMLEVNTTTGAASIINPALITAYDFDGYVIQSPNVPGSLDTDGWSSLEDQMVPGWGEVAPTSNALTELNVTSLTTLAPGDSVKIGAPFIVGEIQDLTFEYNLAGSSPRIGRVSYVEGGPDCGDFDGDTDVDSADRTTQTTNWTGAAQAGTFNKTFAQGDCDDDGDVDTADQNGLIQNWTGAQQAGNLQQTAAADLVYDPATGNVMLDANDTASKQFISFVIATNQNNMLPDNFTNSADGSAGPFFDVGTNTDATMFQIGQTDPLNQGAGPLLELGNILPAGIESVEALADYLTLAEYASELGQGGTMDLRLVPEPSGLALAMFGLLGLARRRCRR